ncbi:MAG TPA: hypothetical protein VFX30_13795 [bacterium]|nr:hypothetical protein [bacterium]
MATNPLNSSTLFQAGLASSTVLLTGCDTSTATTAGVVITGLAALGVGAAAVHRRWSQMQDNRALPPGSGVAGLLQSQNEIPDDVFRSNLSDELVERYTVLGDAAFAGARTVLVTNVFKDWDAQGRPVDATYPQLRGFIPESFIEQKVAALMPRLATATGEKARLYAGLKLGESQNRERRWAPRNVETTIANELKSAYSAFGKTDDADLRARLAGSVVKEAFRAWLKESPSVVDKPGPATPLVEEFLQSAVHKLMDKLAAKTDEPRLVSLLRDLRRDERRRSLGATLLYPRLQAAVRELKALKLAAADARFPDAALSDQLRRAVEALKDFPEAMSREDWSRFAALEGKAGDERAVRELAGRLTGLEAKADETLLKEEAALQQRLRWLQAAVAGDRPVAGLDWSAVGKIHPLLPEWAREVTVRQGDKAWKLALNADGKAVDTALGIEVSFDDGGFWLRDARGLARLHPSNWLRAFNVNGRKMAAGGSRALRSGDRMKVGVDVEIEFLLPEEPPLERLKLRIARIASLEDMARFLRNEGQPSAASRIEAHLDEGDELSGLPQAGGLAAKAAELVLRREAGKLHERYFLNLSYDAAETKLIEIARSVASAASASELAELARESGLSDGEHIAAAIARLFNTGETRSLTGIPVVFGFRERASFFVRESERKMRAEIEALTSERSRLAGELLNANEGISNRDNALTEASRREESMSTELREAKAALVAQERAAETEKTRLLEAHEAARQAWEAAKEQLREQYDQKRQALEANHRTALSRQERAHEAVVAKMTRERADLEKAHGEAVAAAAAAYAAEIKRINEEAAAAAAEWERQKQEQKTQHEADIAGVRSRRDEAKRRLEAAHAAELARLNAEHAAALDEKNQAMANANAAHEMATLAAQAAHEAAMAEKERLHDAALAALRTENVQALRRQAAEHAAALEAQKQDYETQLATLETRRAEWEAAAERRKNQREELRRNWEDEKGRAESLGRELVEEKARVERRNTKIAELELARSSAEAEAARYQQSYETAEADNKRLLEEDLPKLEEKAKVAERKLKAVTSAIEDFQLFFDSYSDSIKQFVGAGQDLAKIEEYLDKLILARGKLEERLAKIEEDEAPPAAPAAEPEMPLDEIEFVDPSNEETSPEIPVPVPVAGPNDVTQVTKRPPASPPPPPVEAAPEKMLGPFFGAVDPRSQKVDIENFVVNGSRDLVSMEGLKIGEAWIAGGNHVKRWQENKAQDPNAEASESIRMALAGGTLVSAKTSAGARDYQEDGVYIAHYKLPDGRTVTIMAGIDGAGGMGGGDVVSSAALQAIHAAVHEAAALGRADLTAAELFAQGEAGALMQKQQHGVTKGTASAGVVVIVGNRATVATKGDAMVVQARRQPDGKMRAVGYSNVQHVESLGNDLLLDVFKRMNKGRTITHAEARNITGGVAMNGPTDVYVTEVQPGDQFLIQSDGGHGNTAGSIYKVNGSREMVEQFGPHANLNILPLSETQLRPLTDLMRIAAGKPNAADAFHDVAAYNQTIRRSGSGAAASAIEIEVYGEKFTLPAKRDPDNVLSVLCQVGDDPLTPSTEALPPDHRPLVAPTSDHFGGGDARSELAKTMVSGHTMLRGPSGFAVGGAVIAAGGAENKFKFTHPDGSLISAQTSRGAEKVSEAKPSQDAYYTATYTLPDGTPVKVMAVSDGAGGMGPHGHIASSGFVQGVHAAVVEAAEAGVAFPAGDFFEAGRAGLLKQKKLHDTHPKTTATASVIVIMGNTATVATLGDATVLHATTGASGVPRTARYSQADYLEAGVMKETTGLIDETKKPHLYFIDNLAHGDSLVLASDSQTNLHGKTYKIQASTDEARKMYANIEGKSLSSPTDATFRTMNQLLTLVNGREDAAHQIHDYIVAAMSRDEKSSAPIPVLGTPVLPADVPDSDHTVVGVIQHAFSAHMGFAAPAGYGSMPEVVALTQQPVPMVNLEIRTDRQPQHHDRFLVIGRAEGLCDEVIPHGTVSGEHGFLFFNRVEQSGFEKDTWYFMPKKENHTGNFYNGSKVEVNQWVPLRGGDRLQLGAVPLFVSVGGGDLSLRLKTDIANVPLHLRADTTAPTSPAVPPAPPSNPGSIPHMPPVPSLKQSPVPPPLPAGINPNLATSGPPPLPPPPPPSRASASPRSGHPAVPPSASAEPEMLAVDGIWNIFMNGASMVLGVSSTDKVGSKRQVSPGVFEFTLLSYSALKVWQDKETLVTLRRNGDGNLQLNRDTDKHFILLGTSAAPQDQGEIKKNEPKHLPEGSFIQIDRQPGQIYSFRSQRAGRR